MLCMVKQIFPKKMEKYSPACNLSDFDERYWQWAGLKYTSYRKNSYPI